MMNIKKNLLLFSKKIGYKRHSAIDCRAFFKDQDLCENISEFVTSAGKCFRLPDDDQVARVFRSNRVLAMDLSEKACLCSTSKQPILPCFEDVDLLVIRLPTPTDSLVCVSSAYVLDVVCADAVQTCCVVIYEPMDVPGEGIKLDEKGLFQLAIALFNKEWKQIEEDCIKQCSLLHDQEQTKLKLAVGTTSIEIQNFNLTKKYYWVLVTPNKTIRINDLLSK